MITHFFVVLLVLAAQGPEQQRGRTSGSGQRATAPQRGSDSLPVSVKLLNTGQTPADSAQHAQEIEQSRILAQQTLSLTERTYRLNLALVGATVVTLLVLGFQSFWLRRDVQHAEKATQIDLRAYLSVEKVTLSHVWPDQTPVADILVENTGRTPARVVQIESRITLAKFPKAGGWTPPSPTAGGSLLGLGAGKTCKSNKALSQPLTAEDFTNLQTNRTALYIDGRIEYRDVFDASQYTNFHFFYNAEAGSVGVAAEPIICDDGNNAS